MFERGLAKLCRRLSEKEEFNCCRKTPGFTPDKDAQDFFLLRLLLNVQPVPNPPSKLGAKRGERGGAAGGGGGWGAGGGGFREQSSYCSVAFRGDPRETGTDDELAENRAKALEMQSEPGEHRHAAEKFQHRQRVSYWVTFIYYSYPPPPFFLFTYWNVQEFLFFILSDFLLRFCGILTCSKCMLCYGDCVTSTLSLFVSGGWH